MNAKKIRQTISGKTKKIIEKIKISSPKKNISTSKLEMDESEYIFTTLRKILSYFGFDETCSQAQVKSSYKDNKCLLYHLDRHVELTESERKELEECFKTFKVSYYGLILKKCSSSN